MKKALLALLAFPVWYREMAPSVTIALGHSRGSQGDSWVWLVGEGVLPGGGAISQGFGEWEELGAEISQKR